MGAPGPPGHPKEDSSISSAELLYGAPLVLPGVPEPPPEVFHESSRAAPSHIPVRGPYTPKELQEVSLQLQGASFVYVCRSGAKLPLAPAYSRPFAVVSRSPKFFVLDLGERSAWTDSSLTMEHPSSLWPPPLAVAALLYRWHLQSRHLGGG